MAKSLLYGVGINDADYVVTSRANGKYVECKIYSVWKSMLARCYNTCYLQRRPSYIGCSVAPEWHTFSNFKKWYLQQGDVTGKQLDKDILYPGNKVYGPDTCIFVSSSLNMFFSYKKVATTEYPIGVIRHTGNKHRNKEYQSRVSLNRKFISAGYYYTPEEAHQAYLKKKIAILEDYYLPQETDQRVIEGLNRWIEVMRNGKYEYV
jgi:hypothetical protein